MLEVMTVYVDLAWRPTAITHAARLAYATDEFIATC